MKSLIVQGQRPDKYKGYIQVKVEPSSKIQLGVYISINDHYEVKGDLDCKAIIDILNIDWVDSTQRAENLIKHLVDTAS